MVFISLLPAGFFQLADALKNGYWHARLTSFYRTPLISTILWARIVPDLIFTAGVIIFIYIVFKAFRNLKKADNEEAAAAYLELHKNDELTE